MTRPEPAGNALLATMAKQGMAGGAGLHGAQAAAVQSATAQAAAMQSAAVQSAAVQSPAVDRRRPASISLWQRSYQLWAESGIQWQRPAPLSSPTAAEREPIQVPERMAAPERVPVPELEPLPEFELAYQPQQRSLVLAGGRHSRSVPWPREADRGENDTADFHAAEAMHQENDGTAELPALAYAQFLGAPVQLSPAQVNDGPREDMTWTDADESLLLDQAAHDDYLRETHPRLMIGRRVMAMGVPVLVLALVGAMAVALLTGHGPKVSQASWHQASPPSQGQSQLAGLSGAGLPSYPGQSQRGVFESVNRVIVSGGTAVATAQQSSAGLVRQQFFVSTNGGTTWQLAPTQSAGGGAPASGNVAPLLAGGPGGWVAVGPQAIWTSADGTSWTLAATHGISQNSAGQNTGGDANAVTKTAAGFLAAGQTGDGRGAVWTSSNGVAWQRSIVPGALSISYATAYGNGIVITGARQAGGGDGAWLSTDGGNAWTPVQIPVSHGGSGTIAGVAADADGLLAVRYGSAANEAVTYFSQNGQSWHYAGTIGASSGLRPRVVKGNGYGLVVAGQDNAGQLIAYLSVDNGSTWRPTAILGNAAAESVVGAAVPPMARQVSPSGEVRRRLPPTASQPAWP